MKRNKRTMKRTKGGVHHQSHHRSTAKMNHGLSVRRLTNMGAIKHHKVPFASSAVPVRNVVGAISYGRLNPTGTNMYMRSVSARSAHNQQKRLREKMIKEDIRHEREVKRLMKEAIKQNENAEFDAEMARLMKEHENMENVMNGLERL